MAHPIPSNKLTSCEMKTQEMDAKSLTDLKDEKKERCTLFNTPNPNRAIVSVFHDGSGGVNVMELDLRTPNGTVNKMASAKNSRPDERNGQHTNEEKSQTSVDTEGNNNNNKKHAKTR